MVGMTANAISQAYHMRSEQQREFTHFARILERPKNAATQNTEI